jgi:hypothetical protein
MDTSTLTSVFQAPGPYATVMLDVSHDRENAEHEHELRVRAAGESLIEQGADESVVQTVSAQLGELVHRGSPVSRLVVANREGILLDEVAGVRAEEVHATWAPLPDLAPWVQHQDNRVTFVLAVVDHEGGDVAVYDSDVPEPLEKTSAGGEDLHINKVPVGGWSALRFLHVTENVWARNARDVAEEVNKHLLRGERLVLLAGDPHSRPMVREALMETGADDSTTIIELETGNRAEDGGDEAMQQAIREALYEHVVSRTLDLTNEVKDRLGRDHAVATGVRDVADAFVRGQVDTLLLDPGPAAELTLDPAQHPGLGLGAGVPEGSQPADRALVAAAVLTDAAVTTVPSATIGGSPVAALLRWDQAAPGSR